MIAEIGTWFSQQYNNPAVKPILEIAAVIIIARVFLWLAQNIFLKLTSKTKTEVDDNLIKAIKNPLYFLIILIGLKIIFNINNLFPTHLVKISNTFISLIYVLLSITLMRILDVVLIQVGTKILSKTKTGINDHAIIMLHRFVSITVWFLVLLLILSQWGVAVGPLLASLGVAGIAVAFALQKTLSNIFGGISLVIDKNISVGDVIDIGSDGTQIGKVLDIGLRSTKIRTFDNEILIVPSGTLADSTFINRAKPNRSIRVKIPFSVAYGSNIENVKKIVYKELTKIEDLKKDEEILVRFLEMANSSLNFTAFFYVNDYSNKFAAKDQANTLIYNALGKHKITIPFPQMDVHLKR